MSISKPQTKGAAQASLIGAAPPTPHGSGLLVNHTRYDAQGNRTITASTLSLTAPTPSTYNSSNRITNSGFTYDGRGNLNGMPGSTATDKFFFDAEDRQITHCPTTTVACTDNALSSNRTIYGYDAEGKRVTKQSLVNGNVRYIYDGHGNLAVEDGAVTPVSGIAYLTHDHLGSVRVSSGGVLERHDYLPFGEEISVASGNPRFGVAGYGVDQVARQKFTGKLRDNESGLDYFGARYFSGAMGRFTGPDENFADQHQDDPQSWNLYAYGRNNPLNNLDDDGRAVGKAVKLAYKAAKAAYKGGNAIAAAVEDIQTVGKGFEKDATSDDRIEAAKAVLGYLPILGEAIDVYDVAKTVLVGGTVIAASMMGSGGESDKIHRQGTDRESVGRLTRKADEAEKKIGIHGVSASGTTPTLPNSTASRTEVQKHFPVHDTPTRLDPKHKTVQLPKPITKQIADVFNTLFGRK